MKKSSKNLPVLSSIYGIEGGKTLFFPFSRFFNVTTRHREHASKQASKKHLDLEISDDALDYARINKYTYYPDYFFFFFFFLVVFKGIRYYVGW